MIQKALPPPLLRIDYEDLRIGSATPDTTLHMQKKSTEYMKSSKAFYFFRLDLVEISAKTPKHQLFNLKNK